MKIVVIDSGYHAQSYCAAALASLGHRVGMIYMPREQRAITWIDRIFDHLRTERPDAVLSINWIGFDRAGYVARVLRTLGIELYVWVVDDPRRVLGEVPVPSCTTHAATWDRQYLPMLQDECASARWLPHAVAPWALEAERAPYSGRVVMVGTHTPARERAVRSACAIQEVMVYGGKEWRQDGAPWLYCGGVRYGPALASVYAGACVLDAPRDPRSSACNQRWFDVSACGGRLIAGICGDARYLGLHRSEGLIERIRRDHTYERRMADWIGKA
jgi:hypothetical protein